MFNKYTLVFFALVASSVAAPVPKIDLTFKTPPAFNPAPVAVHAPPKLKQPQLPDNISQLKPDAQEILAVNFPFPDNIRSSPADAATFDTVVTAIDDIDAAKAAAASDFATAASKIWFVHDTVSGLIGDKAQDGDVSGIVLDLFADSNEGNTLAAACAA
ncbi:hypothetical protein B0H19DRAFT_1319319 [Mycena capillaripes]|nr:hypothetical protein B0H19DRAFT_1319319 [Mycena capillaripes]